MERGRIRAVKMNNLKVMIGVNKSDRTMNERIRKLVAVSKDLMK